MNEKKEHQTDNVQDGQGLHGMLRRSSRLPAFVAEGVILAGLFLLTFLLGCSRGQDTDIWWHLKAGQQILAGAGIPERDTWTFGASCSEWIDLHWGFQVAVASIHRWGGSEALTLATAATATLAVGIALLGGWQGARPAVFTLCWLPAIFLMSGRFCWRPEIVTLLFLAVFLFLIQGVARAPRSIWVLVAVQILWVNVHGLFVLGPLLLACLLVDLALRWRVHRRLLLHVAGATAMVVAVCFANPYGWRGAFFPVTLFRKLSADHDFYARHIEELVSIPQFVRISGFGSVYLWFSFGLLFAAGASFFFVGPSAKQLCFRLLAFLAFTWLGLSATRNQPLFALVAGSVLAWNLGDALCTRSERQPLWSRVGGLAVAAILLAGAGSWVWSGAFYRFAGEHRLLGLGDYPHWHAHNAARFAARPEMPRHVAAFHVGQAAVFEYHMRPEQRVFVDPRLEVMPRSVMEDYFALGQALAGRAADWEQRLGRLPRPLALLIDHSTHHPLEATLLADPGWRCIWFDAVAGLYVPVQEQALVASHGVDFGARHFGTERAGVPAADAADLATESVQLETRALANVAAGIKRLDADAVQQRDVLLLAATRRAGDAARQYPHAAEPSRILGRCGFHLYPCPGRDTSALQWRPIHLLGIARARHCLLRAGGPGTLDRASVAYLLAAADAVGDRDAMPSIARAFTAGTATASDRFMVSSGQPPARPAVPATADRLRRKSAQEMEARRFTSATELFRAAVAVGDVKDLSWPERDRYATLCFLAGDVIQARQLWGSTGNAPDAPVAVLEERRALTHLVECDYATAINVYRAALQRDPTRTDARLGLAICHWELGQAAAATRECDVALRGPNLEPRLAELCRRIRELASRYQAQGIGPR
jgi:hypothetical protein